MNDHPRYVDPPVVHLEQVIYCGPCLAGDYREEAVTIQGGDALCSGHFLERQ